MNNAEGHGTNNAKDHIYVEALQEKYNVEII